MKHSTRIFNSLFSAILLVISLIGAMPVHTVHAAAVTYIVNSTNDVTDGTCDLEHCSLREAILLSNANINPETDIIQFSFSGTIAPVTDLPNIKGNLLMDGAGVKIAINGGNVRRVLYIESGTITLKNLTIQNGNVTAKAFPVGGGVFVNGGAVLHVSSSTFTGNLALNGGAIFNTGTLTISNSTFYNNQAVGSVAYGGGAFNEGMMTIYNSTFSGNTASAGGGGAVYNNTGRTMNLGNTILANSPVGGDCGNAGTIGSNTINLIMDNSCSPAKSGDPKLSPLADNGGSTQTMALLDASPARDAGDATICSTAPVNSLDQRGASRGTLCDIGAYEAAGISTLVIYPNPLKFGEQAIGTSAAKLVTVTYTGTSSIHLGVPTVTGEFAITTYDNCRWATLSPNTSTCTFWVKFSPLTVGPKTGTVTINSNTGSPLGILLLTGTGTNPKLSLSATSVVLPKTYVDTTSLSKTVTITNSGTGTLVMGEFFTSGDFILHSNTCLGAKLPALGTCTFKIAFYPLSPGPHTGQVIIKSNAASSGIPPGDRINLSSATLEGTQLLKMGNFDLVETPVYWTVTATPNYLVGIRNCVVFRSPLCSAKFTGAKTNPPLSALQTVFHNGPAGDRYLISLSSRASRVPLGGYYQLQVRFYGPTGLVGAPTVLFSSGTHAFQTVSTTYTVPAAYTKILYSFTFQKTSGVAWFDDAMLILLP